MKEIRKLKKVELIEMLVQEFGYEAEDLKGKMNIELKEMITKELEFSKKEQRKQYGLATFDDDLLVEVMNNTSGIVNYSSDISTEIFIWNGHGDTQHMSYKELAEMKRRYPRYLKDGWLFILDDDVRAVLCGDDSLFISPTKLHGIFELPTHEMLEGIHKYKGSAYQVIAKNAYDKCFGNEIKDFEKTKALVKEFGFEFDFKEFLLA